MKNLKPFLFYSIAITLLVIFALYNFTNHPEIQLVFLMLGLFIIIVSTAIDSMTPVHNRVPNVGELRAK